MFSANLFEQEISSFNLIPQGRWQIDEVMAEFIDETEKFIESYFGEGERPERRIIDYSDMLQKIRNLLKRIKKGLPTLE